MDSTITKIVRIPQCPYCGNVNCFSDADGTSDNVSLEVIRSKDNYISDNVVCHSCGEVFDSAKWIYLDKKIEISEHDAFVQKRRNSYVREAHLNERIRQFLCIEPKIKSGDVEIIKQYFKEHWTKTIIHRFFTNFNEIDYIEKLKKQHIRSILRNLDKYRWENKIETEETRRKFFCSKYLEKWKKIKKIIFFDSKNMEYDQNQKESYWTDKEREQVIDLFLTFSTFWDLGQPPSMKFKRQEFWIFYERKHFPNFNFIIRKCCEILNIYYDKDDFPIPADGKCLNNLNFLFDEMCSALKIKKKSILAKIDDYPGFHFPELKEKKKEKSTEKQQTEIDSFFQKKKIPSENLGQRPALFQPKKLKTKQKSKLQKIIEKKKK